MGKVKESIVQYGHTTSVKGISKAVKSTRWSLRILWLIAFCIGAAAGIYQIATLLIKYYSYSTYTSISVCNGCHPPFPDVTLCSLNPINLLDEFSGDVLQLDQYLHYIEKYMLVNDTEETFGTSDKELLEEAFGWIYSLQGYFQNIIALDVLDNLFTADFNKELVQLCTWYDWNDNEYDKEKCTDMSMYYFFTDEFFMCTTLHLNESNSESYADQVKAVQALLFVNDFAQQYMPHYHPHIQRSESKGVRVYIHPANTLPQVGKGFNIPPGHEVKISLKGTKIIHEPEPYSDCLEEKLPLEDTDFHESAKEFEKWFINYNYSDTTAASICKQEKVIEACGCYSSSLPFTFKMAKKYPDVTGCTNLWASDVLIYGEEKQPDFIKDVITNIDCLTGDIDIDFQDANCAKTYECEEYQYDYQVSQSTWPSESYLLTFYCNVLREPPCDFGKFLDTPLGEPFSIYENILELMEVNDTEAWLQLRQLDLITRNFIDLKVTFDHPQMIEFRDKPSLTIEQLFGSLGGLFNLWIGITFFTLIELFDLCYVIATDSCCRKDKHATDNADEEKVTSQGNVIKNPSEKVAHIPNDTGHSKTIPQEMESLPRVQ